MCVSHLKETIVTTDFSRAVCVLDDVVVVVIIPGESEEPAEDTGMEVTGM